MKNCGLYAIFLSLSRGQRVRIGKLGVLSFERGTYIYIGSAKRNLAKRVMRHKRRYKKLHWHIDYLRKHCRWDGFRVYTDIASECELADKIEKLVEGLRPHTRFGASDCGCQGHLIYAGMEVGGKWSYKTLISITR